MDRKIIEELAGAVTAPTTSAALESALGYVSRKMGFDHFALSYDEWLHRRSAKALLLHDYPSQWANVYLQFDFGRHDPIRRACERSMTGFPWRDLARYVNLTGRDHGMLAMGKENGLEDGFSVPRHLPGIASGSCTFAVRPGRLLPEGILPIAELVGAQALATARRIAGLTQPRRSQHLSERQRQCVLWAARGKTAGETAKILGISERTVIQHLRAARDRYDVHCAAPLVLCAVFDGLFSFAEVFEGWALA